VPAPLPCWLRHCSSLSPNSLSSRGISTDRLLRSQRYQEISTLSRILAENTQNNVFVECNPAIHVDARGLDQRKVWQDMVYVLMKAKVEAMKVLESPYAAKYPGISTVLPYLARPGGVPPEGNVIRRNLIQGPGLAVRAPAQPWVLDAGGNVAIEDVSFFKPETGAHRVPAGVAFEAIAVDQIGPRAK